MDAKGSALIPMKKFVIDTFGEMGFNKYLENLNSETREVLSQDILASQWYPISVYYESDLKIREVFYNGSEKGSYDCGNYVARYGIRSFYKLFIKFGSPHFLFGRASVIFSTYFKPCKMEVIEVNRNDAILRITEFEDFERTIEIGIETWSVVALEMTGCKNVKITVTKSLTKGDEFTEFSITWD